MRKRKLKLNGIFKKYSREESCVLILKEVNGKRNLMIPVGIFEAESILMEVEQMKASRPMVYDLFYDFAEAVNATIQEIVIYRYHRGIYHSKIYFTASGIEQEMIARTCDAIALGLRFGAAIYTYESILDRKGMIEREVVDEVVKKHPSKNARKHISDKELHKTPIRELKESLKRAIDDEEYELASQIRDELLKRNKNNIKD